MKSLYFIIVTALIYSLEASAIRQNTTGKNFIYDKYKYDEMINVIVNGTTEQILDFYEDSDLLRGYPSRVHVSSNDTINGEYPLFITATQQKGISSWEIPLVVQTSHSVMQFNNMARTLCPHDAGPNITSENRPTMQISTSNPRNVSVDIKLRRVEDFYVEIDKEISLNVTPSTPKYYYFSFDRNPWNYTLGKGFLPRFNYTIPKSVILIIESDDDICAVVSIQNNSCPVFDNEEDMLYQGYHLTMTTKGGITLTQSMFPVGFYVVFIVKQNDEECTGVSETATSGFDLGLEHWVAEAMGSDGRAKNFRFHIKATISYKEYLVGCVVMLSLIVVVALFALVIYIPGCKCVEEVTVVEVVAQPSSSRAEDSETAPIMSEDKDADGEDSDPEPDWTNSMPRTLTLADLSRATHMHSRRSNRYFWSALTVAVVYALPVVQLLSTYQHMVFQTGNQDLCYYNFLCAHPLGFLSDFNHVFSNAGYALLGLAFMAQVRSRQLANRNAPQDVGIPQHHGLFYSMGLALVMEGLLSACYHLCPNKMNFQFDSSFMYVIAVLCMVKIYQNRHPDVNASAQSTFMLLAFIMAIGVYGIMYPSVYYWALFTVAHLAACFILTLKIYYVGRFKLERSMPRRAWTALRTHGRQAFVPNYMARAILLAIANVANWGLAAYGLYEHNKDFARHLLAILLGNTLLSTLFYVIMKVVSREKILLHTWVFLILAHVAWFIGIYLFLDSNTKWSETPAHSRRHNRECTALQFYDSHDAWHLASAAALYLSFNMLLTVDDAIAKRSRDRIPVF